MSVEKGILEKISQNAEKKVRCKRNKKGWTHGILTCSEY
jgi:hypothetical protein